MSDMPGNGRIVLPRFFFHVRGHCHELSRDELGFDLPDVETACLMTISAARDLRVAFAAGGRNPQDYAVEVRNAAGELVFQFPFSAAFDHQETQFPKTFQH